MTQTIVSGCMNSPGHRRETLTAHCDEVSIGTACINNDTYWYVVFGKPKK